MPKNKYDIRKVADTIDDIDKRRVLRFFAHRSGKEWATTKMDAMRMIGMSPSEERKFRLIVADLRNDGYLICSGADGYYLAETLEDVLEFTAREIDARIADLSKTKKAMTENARRVFGAQTRMI